MWIQPKVWKREDFFNTEDYNRIKNNLEVLHELAETLYPKFAVPSMGVNKTDSDYSFYADEINRMEENLGRIRDGIYPYWGGETKVWYENQPFLNDADLNRIEGGCRQLYESLTGQSTGRPRLRCILGRGRCAVCR